jgi:curved DNA-binding protein CbpA
VWTAPYDRMVSHYDVLGVARDASPETIRRAYVALARQYHPDFHTTASVEVREANQRAMQAVNQAWTVLSDPTLRRRYDDRFGQGTSDEDRRARDAADQAERAAWRPFDDDDGEFDPRLLDDEPARVVVSRRQQMATVAPTVLFFAGLGSIAVGLVVNLLPLAALGAVFVLLAALGFLVLPLLALSASVRNDRR